MRICGISFFPLCAAVLLVCCSRGSPVSGTDRPDPLPPDVLPVRSVRALEEAALKVRPGQTILIGEGRYENVKLTVHASGTADRPIVVKAERPGGVLFSGDVRVALRGAYVGLSGICFAQGRRSQKEWRTHGPGLVAMYADHCTLGECLFYRFDTVHSPYVTTSPSEGGSVPTHCRIHHCAFIGKTTLDQVINLDNKDGPDQAQAGPPMYHRVDHCYFSNPRKQGNAGGALRIGYTRQDTGRCLIDHNLFERQDSEAEIITGKSRENVYYANTCLNCRGTLNFRHGDRQAALHNFFIGTDRRWGYGGMFIWGRHHIVGANCFSLTSTLADRGGGALYFNPGPEDSEHACASDVLVINNQFVRNEGYVFCLAPLYERRCRTFGQDQVHLPSELKFVHNIMVADPPREMLWSDPFEKGRTYLWKDNRYAGFTSAAHKDLEGLAETDFSGTDFSKGYTGSAMSKAEVIALLPFRRIEGIDLDFAELIAQGVTGGPLTRQDVGPGWCVVAPYDEEEAPALR